MSAAISTNKDLIKKNGRSPITRNFTCLWSLVLRHVRTIFLSIAFLCLSNKFELFSMFEVDHKWRHNTWDWWICVNLFLTSFLDDYFVLTPVKELKTDKVCFNSWWMLLRPQVYVFVTKFIWLKLFPTKLNSGIYELMHGLISLYARERNMFVFYNKDDCKLGCFINMVISTKL